MADRAAKLRAWLLPGAAERDEKFHQEILKRSHLGLRIIAGIAVAIPALLLLARVPLAPGASGPAGRLVAPVAVMSIGLAAFAAAQTRWSRGRGRLLAGIAVWTMAAVLALCCLFGAGRTADHRLGAYVTFLMILVVAAVPLRPLQVLALGLGIGAWHLGAALVARQVDPLEHLFLLALAALATALAAAVYAQRLEDYRDRERMLRMNELLVTAQTRVLLSENAASLGRLANTVVHELNSPLGALASAVDTLILVASKQATARPEEQPRLLALQADLRRSIRASLERLQETAGRLERLTGLDEAEFQSVDLNGLLRDVASLVETQFKREVVMEFDLQPLPQLHCQPQQLSAVFSNLLSNAAKAMKGCGRVHVSTRHKDGNAEIRIQDTGCGIEEADLATIFEPGFKSAEGRMSTGNWSLFSCRQIIHGHGGEIYITSQAGKGSTVVVTLPL